MRKAHQAWEGEVVVLSAVDQEAILHNILKNRAIRKDAQYNIAVAILEGYIDQIGVFNDNWLLAEGPLALARENIAVKDQTDKHIPVEEL